MLFGSLRRVASGAFVMQYDEFVRFPPSPPPPLYAADPTWQPQFPIGSDMFSAVAISDGGEVFVSQRGNISIDPILVFNTDGELLRSWGKDGVAEDGSTWGGHGLQVERTGSASYRVWIDDFYAHVLRAFDADGKLLLTAGTPGLEGNGTTPVLQFGAVADTIADGLGAVYTTDGDGGTNNRVVKMRVTPSPHARMRQLSSAAAVQASSLAASELSGGAAGGEVSPGLNASFTLEWATAPTFFYPHSIGLHVESGLLLVADREHTSTRLLRSSDGADLGAWDCGLANGGKPFGVRFFAGPQRVKGASAAGESSRSQSAYDTMRDALGAGAHAANLDLLFLATYDNPSTGEHQRIHVIDASALAAWGREITARAAGGSGELGGEGDADAAAAAAAATGPPACSILQELPIDASMHSGPHLLGVDASNGDVYAALVAASPHSSVLRFRQMEHEAIGGGDDASTLFAVALFVIAGGLLLRALCARLKGGRVFTAARFADGAAAQAARDRARIIASQQPENAWRELNPAASAAAAAGVPSTSGTRTSSVEGVEMSRT